MKQLLLTLTLLLFLFHFGFSQNQRVTINGKIIFIDLPISNVNIHNLTTNYGATSNDNGEFNILVKENDTLKISHLEYQTKIIIITDKHIAQGILIVELKIMTNYLNTVTLNNHDLTGNLLTDTKTYTNDTITWKHDLIEDIIAISKESPSNYVEDINLEKPIMNNVDPIGNGGTTLASIGIPIKDKENILRRKLRVKKSTPDKIIRTLGKMFFINDLKIPEEKLYHFITYCESRDVIELFKKNKIMKLIDILTEESFKYHKIINLKDH